MLTPQQMSTLSPLYRDIVADTKLAEELAGSAMPAVLQAGRTICHQGDNCSQLALLTAGSARIFKLAESGREITLYRVEPGECCILTASCMLSSRAFPAHATVEADIHAIVIPAARVITWMETSPVWRQFLWGLLAARLADVIGLVEEVAFRRMDDRLADYLASHAEQRDRILNTTHGQIAADLGTSREVVSRMLKDLEQRGLLALSRGRIEILDAATLRTGIGLCD
ncbi:MAG: Crp/Fnr family transcriptional regulator [Gammaproteobacteria bacterium]|nr:Crp/Fnr family transcriptional regulator [Gammaproteobacteria bacterium]